MVGSLLILAVLAAEGPLVTCKDATGHAARFGFAVDILGPYGGDGLTGSSITLLRTASGYDILTEQPGFKFTVSGDSGRLEVVHDGWPSQLIVRAVYPKNVETYHFEFAPAGGRVAWTQHRFGGTTDKVALFHASCSAAASP